MFVAQNRRILTLPSLFYVDTRCLLHILYNFFNMPYTVVCAGRIKNICQKANHMMII